MVLKWSQNDPKTIPKWSQNYPKMILKRSQNGPKMIPKWFKNDPKMIPKWSQNDPKLIPTWSQHYSKMFPKWSQTDFKKIPKFVYYSPGDRAQKVIPGGAKTNESLWKSQNNVKQIILRFPTFLFTIALVIERKKLFPEARNKNESLRKS